MIAWVNVPDLYSRYTTSLGKEIYMYYGNPLAESQEDVEAVWDENYLAVYHLNEESGTLYDSTANNNHGTPLNGLIQDVDGMIDGAIQFDGSDDRAQLPQIFTTEDFFTIEAWFSTGNQHGRLITQWSGSQGAMIQYYEPDGQIQLFENNNTVGRSTSENEWHFAAALDSPWGFDKGINRGGQHGLFGRGVR